MYMMFIYVDRKPYNTMGIREDDIFKLYERAGEISKDIFKLNPHAKIEVKVTMYI